MSILAREGRQHSKHKAGWAAHQDLGHVRWGLVALLQHH